MSILTAVGKQRESILTAVGKQREIVKESKRTNMIVIKLEAEGMPLDITLFGEYVENFKSFFEQQPLEHPIIVIQYAKVKLFQGNTILQNVTYRTRLLLNSEIEQVIAFRQRSLSVTSQRQPIMLCDDISNVQHSEFLDPNRTRVITTLKNTTEDDSYVVYPTVEAVNSGGD
ncbi:unnamed protein product [Cuscuta campestris]|uniref:Replication protein A OB domain-containing protein n=1 Tax=Cuscuta campestris TaxID=132261 RepID=A0A484MTH0_9ASTE|nr:unnamed protein product [Cuscuta campestris]